jgi:hypothetical protein
MIMTKVLVLGTRLHGKRNQFLLYPDSFLICEALEENYEIEEAEKTLLGQRRHPMNHPGKLVMLLMRTRPLLVHLPPTEMVGLGPSKTQMSLMLEPKQVRKKRCQHFQIGPMRKVTKDSLQQMFL